MRQLNSRADLDRLRDTPDFEEAMRGLYGSTVVWTLVEGAWQQGEDFSTVARFDFTKPQFLAEIVPFDFELPSAPPAPPIPSPVVQRIAKNAIWERASEEESVSMRAVLDQQTVRVREIYAGATHIATNHELYGLLQQAMTALFGEGRAAELLAPTET